MASGGTLLSDLDGKAPIAGDGDLVKMIYHNHPSDLTIQKYPLFLPMVVIHYNISDNYI
jgi:hypothetical protein